jgi:hypothetical protein
VRRLIRENRLLSAIVLWAFVAGSWELTQLGPEVTEAQSSARVKMLGESYPNEPRVMFAVGAGQLQAGELATALETLGAAYDTGYKEDESLYATYIDALVRTQSSRERIKEVVARWRHDYPTSDKLVRMRQLLTKARVLPQE